jgi:hypothetical protein
MAFHIIVSRQGQIANQYIPAYCGAPPDHFISRGMTAHALGSSKNQQIGPWFVRLTLALTVIK